MSLVFYYAPMSSAVTCHWALEELGIPYEKVKVDIRGGGTKTPEFLAVNPNGLVPVLVHDGVTLFESVAILIHLGETFGVEKKLFPAPGLARAEAIKWMVWANVSVAHALSIHQNNVADYVPAERRNAAAGAVAKEQVEQLLGILDAELAKKTWLAGDAFSFADLHLAGLMAWVGFCGFELARWKNIDAWTKRASDRPAFKAVMT